MRIPLEWLSDYVSTELSPEALAERLTMAGLEVEEIIPDGDDLVFDAYVTPNRGDWLSITGVAREVAALTEVEYSPPPTEAGATGPPAPEVRVDIEAPDLCPRYVAHLIRGVKIGPSPEWMQRRLTLAGLRPINNVIDVTNYVMLEMGQPLHAFDLVRLSESRIVVRRARKGEILKVIDGTEVELSPDMLVIADADRPIALAGIMGGGQSEISAGTTDVLLEAASFDAVGVRRTSKRIALVTDSSYRFERGVDANDVLAAASRAARLLAELAGGTVSQDVVDVYPRPVQPVRISFRPERCRQLLGAEVSDAHQEQFLGRLGCDVFRESADDWAVTPPTRRADLTIEADLIEEVGRLYGYDRLPETLPGGATDTGGRSELGRFSIKVREALLAQGLYEAVTNTLCARDFLERIRLQQSPAWSAAEGQVVALRNPISEEFDSLRPSLLPGLLQSAQFNWRRGRSDVFLFETGWAHSVADGHLPESGFLVAGVMMGSRWSGVWNADAAWATDFYAAKGVVESLMAGLGMEPARWERATPPAFHPGRTASATIGDRCLGVVGELHPEVAETLDLPSGVCAFELDGELLMSLSTADRTYQPPSRFPAVTRDLAFVVSREVAAGELHSVIAEELAGWALEIRLFDRYEGKSLGEGRVSLGFRLALGVTDRTLTDEEVDARLERVRARLADEFGAELRA